MRVPFLVLALLLPIANAGHEGPACSGDDDLSLGLIEVGTGDGSVFYVDDNEAGDLVIYEETNGIYTAGAAAHDNLQRSVYTPFFPTDPETCPVEDPNVFPDTKHFDSGWIA